MVGFTISPERREEIITHICEEIAKKRSVASILAQDEGMPCYATFAKWKRESETISQRIAHAREDALEAYIEEIVDISDDATGDAVLRFGKDGKPYATIDGDCVQRAKLRIHARERIAALLAPHRFGQKVDVTSGGEALKGTTINLTQVENRVQSVIMLAMQRRANITKLLD